MTIDGASTAARTSYDAWHSAQADEEDEPTATTPWHEMAKLRLGDVRGKRVLEIGCGRGAFARWLQEQGADVTAADFSPAAVELAARLLGPETPALVADVQQLPFPDEHFDVVVSLETLEHVPDPAAGLAELVRVTRHGGRLVVTTPNYLNLLGLYRIALRLAGRRFTEGGQPINQPLILAGRVLRLRRLGCRVDAVDGCVHTIPVPGFRTIDLEGRGRPAWATRWVARHGLTAATRL